MIVLFKNESINEKTKGFERIMQLFEASNSGLWEMSEDGGMNFFNSSFYKDFDLNLENSNLLKWTALIHPEDLVKFNSNVELQITDNIESFKSEYRVKDIHGDYRWIEGRGVGKYNKNKNLLYMVGSHIDITERKLSENRIYHLAYHDYLTGLYNRSKLMNLLEDIIGDKTRGALIYLSLNNFKLLIDTYGREFGDDALKSVAENMKRIFHKKCDHFKLEECEFALLTHDNFSKQEIIELLEELHKSICKKLCLKGKSIQTHLSAGIYEFPVEMDSAEELIHQTRLTMRYAKRNPDDKYAFFDKDIQKSVLKELHIETGLIKALENNEMYLNYQPIIDAKTGIIESFEALLRWKSEEWGEIYPDQFIPVAEKTQEIIEIGLFVLRSACKFINKYKHINDNIPNMSVNVSVIQLLQVDFADQVMRILKEENIDPSLLTIEITESLMFDTQLSSINQLKILKENGIGIALDDFGTGYSSLNNLLTIPLTKLKIDREVMVKAMLSLTISEFVSSVTVLCHQNGLKVVAEGIETDEMTQKAKFMGADLLQGYLYSKPISEEKAIVFLE